MTGTPTILDRPSPNHDARPDGTSVDILLLHYTGMQSADAALDRLTDGQAKVSAHYLIAEDGSCWRLVEEERRAWHAGVASWGGATDINARSIGIELVNPGHQFGYRPFPALQMDSLTALCRDILARHPIQPARVLGHSDVAPERKEDPGELFDWASLAKCGVGLWPEPGPTADPDMTFEDAMRFLAHIGYAAPRTPVMTGAARNALLAFQRRWLPSDLCGALTPETAARIRDVHAALTSA
ncbi:N-acetylmuramoyl-L-alanine amidase [Nisaea sp.]|uniref:N-acetylmuramoyl-L-alanine amidase n=1 Tax=Nisaea sp. TaxID=2024842 RepID=UPI003B522D30